MVAGLLGSGLTATAVDGWLQFRGPNQNGTSPETNLPDKVDLGDSLLWTADLSGRSAATVANGKVYVMGYAGEGPDLQELIACFDAETGKPLWEHRFNDFISDIIYTRYATSSPTIDPETGNVYMQGTQGVIAAFTADGKLLWQHSMMEKFGRMTFPNGRTATFHLDGDNAITHHIMANWGANGPARDRFYAFDKHNGELVWYSTPGGPPKDSSYSPPVVTDFHGQKVIYSGTGDGSVVCFNALTGDPIWASKISQGGINSGVIVFEDRVIAIHGNENLDSSEIGRMVALKIPDSVPASAPNQPHWFDMKELEIWRNPASSFASHPVLVGDHVFQLTQTGDLIKVATDSGEILWKKKLGIEQRTGGPLYADGKLYVTMLEDPDLKDDPNAEAGTRGAFYIVDPDDGGILSKVSLEGTLFGSPTAYNGKIYVHSAKRLYCFGKKGNNPGVKPLWVKQEEPAAGSPAQLQIIPAEVLLRPGQAASFRVRVLDAGGRLVEEVKDVSKVKWEGYIPPTAKVKASMDAAFNSKGQLAAGNDAKSSAGAYKATYEGNVGYIRGRVLPNIPFGEDLEEFEIDEVHPAGHMNAGVKFAYPPLPWIGARFKFEIHEVDGNKVLAKTIDNKLFQRATVFMGDDTDANYTIAADIMTDGNRRKMSEVGLVNQHYNIVLKGNAQELEVNSNLERIRESVKFPVKPKVWYRLKTRVDVSADGSGVVRAKVWPKGEAEPDAWTIEVPHKHAHTSGSPGLFGFSPQEMRVYIDNISVTPN